MGFLANVRQNLGLEERDRPLSIDEWASYFSFDGLGYGLAGTQTLGSKEEAIGGDFAGLIAGAYKANGVVFACMAARQLLFAEASFQFRNRQTGNLFGTNALQPLEAPWTTGTTSDLLARAIQDVDLAGNFFAVRRGDRIRRLRPDWVTIVMGGDGIDFNLEVLGYIYEPGGRGSQEDPVVLRVEEVAHYAPIPDPQASFRGMSWLSPIVREIMGDKAATLHKLKFFEQGATPNMVVTMDPTVGIEAAKRWKDLFLAENEGIESAYKTLFLGGGATQEVVGANLRQIDFKVTQGAGETRIAAAARVPPVIVGLSEGLAAATYSNYGQARRAFADGTIRPLWRNLCGSLEALITIPSGAQLWYDDRDIPFVQEDRKDDAEIKAAQAGTLNTLITAGFTPESANAAVISGDFRKLVHSGMTSVQLHTPGEDPAPSTNGAGPPAEETPVPDTEGEE